MFQLPHQVVVRSEQRGSLRSIHSQLSGNLVRIVHCPSSNVGIFFFWPKVWENIHTSRISYTPILKFIMPDTYCEPGGELQFYFQFVVCLSLGSIWRRHQNRLVHLRCTLCAAHSCTIGEFPTFHPNNIGAARCRCIQSLRGVQSRGEVKVIWIIVVSIKW